MREQNVQPATQKLRMSDYVKAKPVAIEWVQVILPVLVILNQPIPGAQRPHHGGRDGAPAVEVPLPPGGVGPRHAGPGDHHDAMPSDEAAQGDG